MKMHKLLLILAILSAAYLPAFAQAPQEKFMTVFGVKIRYLEAGDTAKPTVILVHGMGGNADNWSANMMAISASYHVIAPDQVGFGKSGKPIIKYRVGVYVDFLDKMMSLLKIEKATLIGHSLGGWIAGLYAVKYPNRVNKLVLVDSGGLMPRPAMFAKLYQLNATTRDELKESMSRAFYDQSLANDAGFVDMAMEQRMLADDGYTFASLLDSINRKEDFIDKDLGKIKKPTLIVWGKQDKLIELTEARKFNKGIAGSELIVFDKCGHAPQLEKAADFNKKVLEFLEKR